MRLGLCMDDSRIAMANIKRIAGQKSVLHACAFRGNAHDKDWRDRAESRIKGADLDSSPVSTVMSAETYHTLLVEIPNVPDEEMTSAVRWRIKDIVDYANEDMVIEILPMPEQSNPGHKPMAYAVASERASIQKQIDIVEHNGLQMDVIDIPELCIRNIAAMLPQDDDGVAFLHFTELSGILTITRGGVLYLLRRIEFGRSAFDTLGSTSEMEDVVNRIALELQRSLDYYESHYDRKPIGEIVLGPGAGIAELAETLNKQLELSVKTLDLTDLFELQTPISVEEQGNCLLAIGAALRAEQAAAPAD